MKKKIPVIMLIVGFILIIVGAVFMFLKKINNAKKEIQEIEEKIIKDYKVFEQEVEKFNELRLSYSENISNDLYKENVKDEYEDWIIILDDYTKTVDDITIKSEYLQNKCVNKKYSNKDIVSKCDSFVIAYETVVNYYTKDITEFNKVINEYLNENKKNDLITEYKLKYNHTDIDGDGNFHGKD